MDDKTIDIRNIVPIKGKFHTIPIQDYCLDNINATVESQTSKYMGGRQYLKSPIYGAVRKDTNHHLCFRSAKESEFNTHWINSLDFSDNFVQAFDSLFCYTRGALNNSSGYDKIRSFSKRLAAPLFKFYRDSPSLAITHLPLNTLSAEVTVQLYNWCERGYDEIVFDVDLPFSLCWLSESAKLNDMVVALVHEHMAHLDASGQGNDPFYQCDIDNIAVKIQGFTFDVSDVERSEFRDYFDSMPIGSLKFAISYKADDEVLTTQCNDSIFLSDQQAIEVIRFLYILRIYGKSSIFDTRLDKLVHSIDLSCESIYAINYISNYLAPENSNLENRAYSQIFRSYSNYAPRFPIQFPPSEATKPDVANLLIRLQTICFNNEDLFKKMMCLSEIEA